jgi:peptidoglycan/LPS O-acetylase OafA/YrhL
VSGYRPAIDGLRALAIVPVVLFHAGVPGFGRGYLGVDVFFVISGFLITGLLLAERRRTGTIAIGYFYERRVRRIAPALAVMVASAAAAAWCLVTPARMLEIGHSVVAAFTFSANFWFLAQSHYFATEETFQPLIHVWSLAVEEQFYLGPIGSSRRRSTTGAGSTRASCG